MSEIIQLVYSNGNIFIWNADDWLTLRKEYRIVGELLGCLPKTPRQDILLGLPLLLSPEEAKLLIEKGFARLIQYPCIKKKPSETLKKLFHEFREKLYLDQEVCLRKQREKQISGMMDKIVEGKRRKILGLETTKKKMRKPLDKETLEKLESVKIDRKLLFEEEMSKLPKLDRNDALVQTHTAHPWVTKEDAEEVDWNYPQTEEENLRYRVFKDLWEKNYYVTNGEKFGGDFLVYPSDPIMFHAQFIVHCQKRSEDLSVNDIISVCRVGCNVRKTQVFASFSPDGETINYQSLQWAESSAL